MKRKQWAALVVAGIGGTLTLAGLARKSVSHSAQVATAAAPEPNDPAAPRKTSRIELAGASRIPAALATPAAAKVGADAQTITKAQTYEERLEAYAPFKDFVAKAKLSDEQSRTLSKMLALFYRNQEAIESSAADQGEEQVASMQRQLFGDTVAQIRGRLPDESWRNFVRAGLLVGATDDTPAAL